MNTFEAISKRTSVREYRKDPIERPLLETLVDSARRAPSARAVEPWEFVVVTDRDTLVRLSETCDHGRFLKGAAACLAVFCRDTKYYLEDGCAATENALIAAADMGLGACWIAGDKKPYAAEVKKILDVPREMKLISLVSLGWPAEAGEQSKSRELADLIHWERYNKKEE
ncbi:MAG: nitroreductase family protein [Candidatus Omnitrophica bacterium]|nr:nitroreductase family protein [Candidatus Omnitrophota bacterium]